jgi:formate dehydrogenase
MIFELSLNLCCIGDVWNVQPAPKDHVWRTMKNPLKGGNGMVPHYSGTTLDAQARYAAGVKSILDNYLNGKPQEPQNIIVGKSACIISSQILRMLTI